MVSHVKIFQNKDLAEHLVLWHYKRKVLQVPLMDVDFSATDNINYSHWIRLSSDKFWLSTVAKEIVSKSSSSGKSKLYTDSGRSMTVGAISDLSSSSSSKSMVISLLFFASYYWSRGSERRHEIRTTVSSSITRIEVDNHDWYTLGIEQVHKNCIFRSLRSVLSVYCI